MRGQATGRFVFGDHDVGDHDVKSQRATHTRHNFDTTKHIYLLTALAGGTVEL